METIAAYAREMRDFLVESELTERRAFIESFVKEIVVTPDDALLRYTVPMPEDSLIPGGATEKVALDGAVLPTVKNGGLRRSAITIMLHEEAELIGRTSQVRDSLHDPGEHLRIGQRNWKGVIQGIVIPVHFR